MNPLRSLFLLSSMLFAGVAGAAVNTYSASPALVVPDVSTVMSTINVPDTGTLNSITVTLTLHHPQTADVVIRLTDPELYKCPFIMMTEPGALYMDEQEAASLRDYLLRGGFLWADDFWGDYAFQVFENEMRKALPSATYPIVDLPLGHTLFHMLYDVKHFPQIPSIGVWLGSGQTSERGPLSATPHARAIFDPNGRRLDPSAPRVGASLASAAHAAHG